MNEPTLRVRYIGRCRKCKATKTVDITAHQAEAKTRAGHKTTRIVQHSFPSHVVPACPSCGSTSGMAWEKLQGTHSDKHRCDDRCLSAKGPICVCECGGANHGSHWL